VRRLYFQLITVIGGAHGEPQDVEHTLAEAAAGRIRPLIAAVLPLEQARQAHEMVEAGQVTGKILLVP
jgi:NADPH2:quinone reductase